MGTRNYNFRTSNIFSLNALTPPPSEHPRGAPGRAPIKELRARTLRPEEASGETQRDNLADLDYKQEQADKDKLMQL